MELQTFEGEIKHLKVAESLEAELYLSIVDDGEWHVHILPKLKINKEVYRNLILDLTDFEDYVIMQGLTDTLYTVVPVEDEDSQNLVAMFGFEMINVLYEQDTEKELYYKYKKELV
jgi:hypothetical protein